jgi:hypothetical protein
MSDSGTSQNLGPIIGGVVGAVFVLVLGAVLVCYFLKRRSIRNSLRSNDLSSPHFLPPSAQPELHVFTTQGPLSSQFDAPSDTTSHGFSKYSQTGLTVTPHHSTTSHTAIYTSAIAESTLPGESLTGANVMRTPPTSFTSTTVPPNLSATTNFSSTSSVSEAHQGFRINDRPPVGLPAYSLQDLTAGPAPLSSLSTNVAIAQIPDEPVEQGLMSWRASMVTTLPPYSPRGLLHDERAPPLPER